MRTTVLVILFAIFSCTTSFSQVSVLGYGSFIRNLNPENKTNTYGGGIRFEFAQEATNFSKYFGFAYALPMHCIEELEAQSMSSRTDPSHVKVTANYARPMIRLEGGGNLYLKGEPRNIKGVNWYIGGGVEVIYMGNKPSYSYYDEENYTLGYTKESDGNLDGSSKFVLNLHIAVLTGIEKNVGPGNVFLQTGFSFPAVTATASQNDTDSQVESFSPIPLNLNFGYKILFGSKKLN